MILSLGTMYGSIEVTLRKQKHSSLGLTISGGADRGCSPRITTIKPGSIADKCVIPCLNLLFQEFAFKIAYFNL